MIVVQIFTLVVERWRRRLSENSLIARYLTLGVCEP